MLRIRTQLLAATFVLAAAAIGVTPAPASAATYDVLHSFCQETSCTDGTSPSAGLLRDSAGNLYGTTAAGGPNFSGVVFQLSPNGAGWKYKVIAHFCHKTECKDGGFPSTRLIMDVNGTIYGTNNGSIGGTVFALVPNETRTKWKLQTLHAFCPNSGDCVDGLVPLSLSYAGQAAGLPYDGVSPLYGTTQLGGVGHGGTVFSLTPPAAGETKWTEQLLYSFCNSADCSDGFTPTSGPLLDSAGNVYGTTSGGGATGTSGFGEGVLYKLTPNVAHNAWTYSILYSFCQHKHCADGKNPLGTLVMDNTGAIWGEAGGGFFTRHQNGGVVYKWNGTQTVVHSFCPAKDCTDGQQPAGGLSIDAAQNVYGVTQRSLAAKPEGTVFKITPDGTLTTLHAFCTNTSKCPEGGDPNGDLVLDSTGRIFGTTASGGVSASFSPGTIFALSPLDGSSR